MACRLALPSTDLVGLVYKRFVYKRLHPPLYDVNIISPLLINITENGYL